jgi:hypothetical protein
VQQGLPEMGAGTFHQGDARPWPAAASASEAVAQQSCELDARGPATDDNDVMQRRVVRAGSFGSHAHCHHSKS